MTGSPVHGAGAPLPPPPVLPPPVSPPVPPLPQPLLGPHAARASAAAPKRMRVRSGDGRYQFEQAFRERILGPLDQFWPDLVIISAGFDAHRRDPIAGLELEEADFAWATEMIAEKARRYAGGRLVSMLEGGYELTGLSRSVAVHVKALMEAPP